MRRKANKVISRIHDASVTAATILFTRPLVSWLTASA